ncbi:RNA-binding protein [Xylophilus rhododendri]|uniref:RNA-binding protein n=1 Tax=Xylophilus rhododendri TaxID=2697032 RepID=A0A857J0W7_9BURK|nr:RNA-binding protein [Xylophilus rhododendri]QHI97524.1 RNA-binding protein [Xylophilus rhododendri]
MSNKLYVGNLPYTLSSDDLTQMFSEFGTVLKAQVVIDRDSGRSKGFGFVEMSNDSEAQQAIGGMHEKKLEGRPLTVNEARPQEPRAPRSNDGYGRRGGY